MRTRNGKIARLPHVIREELNLRLERSERSPQLLAWLNALPDVREVVQGEFGGEPVSKHNLSHWRRGGYQDWLTRRDFYAEARSADDFIAERNRKRKMPLADNAATVLAARLGALLMHWDGRCTREFEAKARVLSEVSRGIVELQKEARQSGLNPVPSQSVAVSSSDKIAERVGPPSGQAVFHPTLDGNSWHKRGDSE